MLEVAEIVVVMRSRRLESNHSWHFPRPQEDCQINQNGFLRIISFNSDAYRIINLTLSELKKHPKVLVNQEKPPAIQA
jgi:hypothetical protein